MKNDIQYTMMDGNEATAYIAYRINEICAIYPITPSSAMAEHADEWSADGVKNIWGNVPLIIEMQSEGGAAGAVHGALQAGALTTTFTASQGLMLMLPNMYKIAGELTSVVIHVAARALAAQGLSIFGDHSDVMAARTTGFALLSSSNVQEAHDFALISQATSLRARIPFLHFFDGFRTSHEINKIALISNDVMEQMMVADDIKAHRERALSPDHPFIRGTAQNPDVYFQGRETVNLFYQKVPQILQEEMDKFAQLTQRQYHLFSYDGDPYAEEIIVIMGSGSETTLETVKALCSAGRKVGVLKVHLFRPFSISSCLEKIPKTVQKIAVLDRCKEPGASGEPLYMDIIHAFFQSNEMENRKMPKIIGGRYGLGSKEFTPAMVKGIFDHLKEDKLKNSFTIGIKDDLTYTNIDYNPAYSIEKQSLTSALFFGLGADGTVGANKNSIKIIGENTALFAQGYFVYDSKKSGSKTISHLRFGPDPIHAPYLITAANFIACHQFNFIGKMDILKNALPNATFLVNSPFPPEVTWDKFPETLKKQIIDKNIYVFTIDALKVAAETGMGKRINTIMQTCFFAISGVLPKEEAIKQIKKAIEKSYLIKGQSVVDKNFLAVNTTLENLFPVTIKPILTHSENLPIANSRLPQFVQDFTIPLMNDLGDELPVSKMPNDGTFPSGTTQWEKRNIADEVPVWEPDLCIQCGNCSFVCPHSVIRAKFFNEKWQESVPESFKSAPINARGFPETLYSLAIYAEDCTGCTLCVDACPAENPDNKNLKAINMRPFTEEARLNAMESIQYFEAIPWNDRTKIDFSSVRGSQFLTPLFEFSGACAGCGETPYLGILSRLFGDRLLIANATGCSSIYGGNLPTTPWTKNEHGKGPAWANSLFEDNAEFGLGMRIAVDKQAEMAAGLLLEWKPLLPEIEVEEIINASQLTESQIFSQRERIAKLKTQLLAFSDHPKASALLSVVDHLVRRSVWLIGGDGWAYDIGSSGVDHALASGKNINILVLDTEVYSNTGGQMSKATPTGASAKFASGGKQVGKKDLALQAISYGNVYVAKIAMGANAQQTLLALREAEAYPGPSIVLAYSHCIAHGIDMEKGMNQQQLAVASGYWPLLRYNPELRKAGHRPFVLDSPAPRTSFESYAYNETRYKSLTISNPEMADKLLNLAKEMVDLRWQTYMEMAEKPASSFKPVHS